MERVDTIVIGAGVVGLAVARALGEDGREVMVLEQHAHFGSETSSRNSEVIHAGIYYRPGGLRAQLCHPGKELLYAYCEERHVPYERCGKLVVAHNDEEIEKLRAIIDNARQCGVVDLEIISRAEAQKLEPALECHAALVSPSSGIIDSHTLMLTLIGDIENAGGALVTNAPVTAGAVTDNGVALSIGGDEAIDLEATLVVNCAGLHADKTARSITGLDAAHIFNQRPAKGQYFTYSGAAPFSRLIYPLHTKDSQGVHYSRDLGGQARLGPDITWDAALGDYEVDRARRDYFATAAQRFWPDLDREKLHPGYAGQRPKTAGPGEEGDFRIVGPEHHGAKGYIGLYGIESPGLTSCLAIGRYVSAMARGA